MPGCLPAASLFSYGRRKKHIPCRCHLPGGARQQGITKAHTPYSMNSLFSEFFRDFGGVLLEVCETISGAMWEVCGGIIEENYPENKNEKLILGSIEYCLK